MSSTAPSKNEEIISWLRQNSIPIQHITAGSGFADLQPLKTMLAEAKVIGLGETTHGTREFFQLKHRLLEFLVTEMGFNLFAIEASFAACQPINDFVLHGKGELATVLTEQGYVPWDTEELTEMLGWIRTHNMNVPVEKKVQFLGVDLWRNDFGRHAVLDYLHTVDPNRYPATQILFETLSKAEAKWPAYIDEATRTTLEQLLPQIENLLQHLIVNKDALVSHSSSAQFSRILQYVRVMLQWLIANTPNTPHPLRPKGHARSVQMAENLVYLLNQGKPDAKCVFWAHNYHVALEDLWNGDPNCGYHLRKQFGSDYVSLGFEFNQGSFYTRTALAGGGLGALKIVTLPAASSESWSWYLDQTNRGDLLLNLRAPIANAGIRQWLNTPRHMHNANWGYDEKSTYGAAINLLKKFDGIIFVENTTPSRNKLNV